MVNLLITMKCNRSCEYCFATEKIHQYKNSSKPIEISLENVSVVIDFLKRSNCSVIQLAGGEPTIHPKFLEIMQLLLANGFQVNLLSNALWKNTLNDFFTCISPSRLVFLLNIDHPSTYDQKSWERINDNLSAIYQAYPISLSFNIFEEKPKVDYIFDLVSKYEITTLRLSFSMPNISHNLKNTFLSISKYKQIAPFVIDFVQKAETSGAIVTMDNTIPICMFETDILIDFILKGVINPNANFNCIPAIDIGPDLSVWRCFGTSTILNKKLDDYTSLSEIEAYYNYVFNDFRYSVFPLKECYDCKYAKEKICQGGCLGFKIDQKAIKETIDFAGDKLLNHNFKFTNNVQLIDNEFPPNTFSIVSKGNLTLEFNKKLKPLFVNFINGSQDTKNVFIQYIYQQLPDLQSDDPLKIQLANFASENVLSIIRNLVYTDILEIKNEKNSIC